MVGRPTECKRNNEMYLILGHGSQASVSCGIWGTGLAGVKHHFLSAFAPGWSVDPN